MKPKIIVSIDHEEKTWYVETRTWDLPAPATKYHSEAWALEHANHAAVRHDAEIEFTQVRSPEDVYAAVIEWTRKNEPQMWAYNARYNWYRSALINDVITKVEHDNAQRWHGRMWTYVGD